MSHLPPDDSHAKGARRATARLSSGIDLGHEPPLNTSGSAAPEVDKWEVNLRWLGASILTGVTGAALIGASIYIALEGAATSALPPERATVGTRTAASGGEDRAAAVARKADRLNRTEQTSAARQNFKAPMTIRSGEREAIKVRHFVRVATNLSLSAGTYASDIPPFNPLRLFAEDTPERTEPTPEITDADVSVLRRDLAAIAIAASAPSLTDSDVLAMLEEERRVFNEAGRRTSVPIPAQQMLSRTLRQPEALGEALGYARVIDAPFSAIEVRVVPENVTELRKAEQKAMPPLIEERDVVLRKGETLETALRSYGATPEQIAAISSALAARIRVESMTEGQRLRILIAPGPRLGDPRQIVRVIAFGERGVEGIAAANDRGVFVSAPIPTDDSNSQAAQAPEEDEEDEGRGGVRLYESLYETALKNDLPRQTVDELVRIFGYDVDFQRRVSQGDSFEVLFGSDDENGTPEILFASLTVGGEQRRVYRYQGEDGAVDFFDESGRSLKKFLIRKPIADGILRSGFGSRFHPILGYSRPHTGVDWAHKVGTPIIAAGNGTVIKAEWDSGYGRRVEIQHTNGYVTAYSHMSSFAKGIAPGRRVQQGQVIGYVGNSGLSTGPHLHYEVIINGSFVDPLKIRLPRGRELEGRGLVEFKRQREQIDELMSHNVASASLSQRAELR
ncbi:M23 family metallopeptidase [Microvirga arsenatis]|uniref:Peptidoglycan DD-metalloendopeptidase family protein n=1 Tax=Microvirga arsenatis TaxID=2692265 RepID=A0ABW9YVV7_9HYPH|nr:M23 family metallopeptidase [Microvirga arsenatis]NBJ10635.1 peptidoglycan DD-metalloendopeptidase family protein [Microvirga arsenatis]NBJ24466.1 peptidoglycan DD-metalloendopeptidase family protein [Microvirga arsenatis]